MFNLIYKANPALINDVEQIIKIDFDLLTESHKQLVKKFKEDKQKKIETIQKIYGEVIASAIREKMKALKKDDDTKRATKLINDLMAHAQKDIEDMSMLQIDNLLQKATELQNLKKKLKNKLDTL